jgi:hypothetical protein
MSLLQDSYAALEKKIVVKPYKPIWIKSWFTITAWCKTKALAIEQERLSKVHNDYKN